MPELARFLETSRASADDTAQVPHDELLERLTLPAFEQVEDQVVFASSLCEPRALRHLGQVHHSRLRAQLRHHVDQSAVSVQPEQPQVEVPV